MATKKYIFFYGTLRPGQHNYTILAPAVESGHVVHVGQAKTTGSDFTMVMSFGRVPYLFKEAPNLPKTAITGDLFECVGAGVSQELKYIHRMELNSGYVASTEEVQTADGKKYEALMYIADMRVAKQCLSCPVIESGDYTKAKKPLQASLYV